MLQARFEGLLEPRAHEIGYLTLADLWVSNACAGHRVSAKGEPMAKDAEFFTLFDHYAINIFAYHEC